MVQKNVSHAMSNEFFPCRALLPNTKGRDFFVGDIHGHFDKLAKALQEQEFSPTLDRLISVGDLIDRGENSDVALSWLKMPYFHAIRGNHEELFLSWCEKKRFQSSDLEEFEQDVYFKNGGAWVQEADQKVLDELEQLLIELPYLLAVPAPTGEIIGVIHAELPDGASWPGLMGEDWEGSLRESILWGRERMLGQIRLRRGDDPSGLFLPLDNHEILGFDAVVCGHIVVKEPTKLGNIVYLDTGGWRQKGYFSVLTSQQILSVAKGR